MVRSVQQPQFDSDLRPFAARLPAFLSTLQSNKGKKSLKNPACFFLMVRFLFCVFILITSYAFES